MLRSLSGRGQGLERVTSPPSREAKRLSFVLWTNDPRANAAEVAAKNDRVGFAGVESLDVDGNALLPAARSYVSVSNDHENML